MPESKTETGPGDAPEKTRDQLIREKVKAGLTMEQASDVIDRQAESDANAAKAAKKSGK